MNHRSMSRELALKRLYSRSVGGDDSISEIVEQSMPMPTPNAEDIQFIDRLVDGVAEHSGELDELIQKCAVKWSIERMPKVDLCIMRMALYEILYEDDIPHAATINEAVELGKKYGDSGSARFINGVLGAALNAQD